MTFSRTDSAGASMNRKLTMSRGYIYPKKKSPRFWQQRVLCNYTGADPTGERFILCPPENWETFVNAVRAHFQGMEDVEKIFRLLCCGLVGEIDSQCRIRITKACLEHAKLGPGQRVNMLGVGLWFEVSVYIVSKER